MDYLDQVLEFLALLHQLFVEGHRITVTAAEDPILLLHPLPRFSRKLVEKRNQGHFGRTQEGTGFLWQRRGIV